MAWQRAYYVLGSLNLNDIDGDYLVTSFRETTGGKGALWASGDPARDGRARTEVSYPNKKFRLTLSIRPQDDTSTLESVLRALHKEIVRADDEGDTLWLYHRPAADTTWGTVRKIKVLHADCKVPVDERLWKSLQLSEITLDLECEEAWRGDEVTFSFADSDVENADDSVGGGRDNFVSVSASSIKGDLPGFLTILCTSTDGPYTAWRIAQKKDQATSLSIEFSGTAENDCSGGEYQEFTTDSTTWETLASKTVAATSYYGLYRVFARVNDRYDIGGTLYLRMRWGVTEGVNGAPNATSRTTNSQKRVMPVRYGTGSVGHRWVDVPLGVVDFRESTWKQGSYEPVYFSITLQAKRTSITGQASEDKVWVDRLFLMPLDEGYLWAGREDGTSEGGDTLVVSSEEGRVYLLDGSDKLRFYPSLDGAPFHLEPHPVTDVTLYFLWEQGDDPSESVIYDGGDQQMVVVVKYVPRYL